MSRRNELHRVWVRKKAFQLQGEWWLRTVDEHNRLDPWRAYITKPNHYGDRVLMIWRGPVSATWENLAVSKNLRALKAIGRLEAQRRLNV